ncbi:MAG: hypothetical protein GX833_02045 [Clostridium sp.]|jgi:hypothetical protein|nr:hypothetical protein [Clostridium sp.]
MEYKMNVEINLERPLKAHVSDNEKLEGLIQFLTTQGFVVPGSVEIDETSGHVKIKATEALLQYAEKYLK